MLRAVLRRLTYANVIATLALFLALGGGAVWAANKAGSKIGTGKLKPNAVTAGKIKANAVTTSKIRENAVTNVKLREGAVNFGKLAAGTNVVATATSSSIAVNGRERRHRQLHRAALLHPGGGRRLPDERRSAQLEPGPVRHRNVPGRRSSRSSTARMGRRAALVLSAFEPTAEAPSGVDPGGGADQPDRPRRRPARRRRSAPS